MEKAIVVHIDGCCEPINPGGTAGWGVHMQKGDKIWTKSGMIPASPNTSNNVAEYAALKAALTVLINNNKQNDAIEIYGDSQLVIKQMKGEWRIKKGAYTPYAHECRKLLTQFKNISFNWIPREKNEIADELSKAELNRRNVNFRIQPEN